MPDEEIALRVRFQFSFERLGVWIVADRDWIVVVPALIAEDVIAEAEGKAGTENEIRTAVRAGTTPLEAYERYGTF